MEERLFKQNVMEEMNITDAEIFAIATLCGLDLDSELHLLNFLVTIIK